MPKTSESGPKRLSNHAVEKRATIALSDELAEIVELDETRKASGPVVRFCDEMVTGGRSCSSRARA